MTVHQERIHQDVRHNARPPGHEVSMDWAHRRSSEHPASSIQTHNCTSRKLFDFTVGLRPVSRTSSLVVNHALHRSHQRCRPKA